MHSNASVFHNHDEFGDRVGAVRLPDVRVVDGVLVLQGARRTLPRQRVSHHVVHAHRMLHGKHVRLVRRSRRQTLLAQVLRLLVLVLGGGRARPLPRLGPVRRQSD